MPKKKLKPQYQYRALAAHFNECEAKGMGKFATILSIPEELRPTFEKVAEEIAGEFTQKT